jgi:serine/threonine protein kinase
MPLRPCDGGGFFPLRFEYPGQREQVDPFDSSEFSPASNKSGTTADQFGPVSPLPLSPLPGLTAFKDQGQWHKADGRPTNIADLGKARAVSSKSTVSTIEEIDSASSTVDFSPFMPRLDDQKIQASSFTGKSKERTVFRTTRFEITGDYRNRCLLLRFEDGSNETVRLIGTRVNFGELTGTSEDVQPSFVENSICIRSSDATSGWFLACRTRALLLCLTDRLCLAGCIMADLALHCSIARDAANQLKQALSDGSGYALIPARPKTSRTASPADVVVLKVAIHEKESAALLNEVHFLMTLSHVGIPRAYGIYDMNLKGNRVLAMITDVVKGTPLSALVPAQGFPELVMTDLMAQLCDVLVYLHGLFLVHRNIKPEHVLCEGAEDGGVRVVLADFDAAKQICDTLTTTESLRGGTPGYMAPELFRDSPYTWPSQLTPESSINITKIDVFSFGLVISTMLTGANPFHGDTYAATYRNNAELKYDPGLHFGEVNIISAALRSLLCSLCERDPCKRYSAAEAASHPWFGRERIRVKFADLHKLRGSWLRESWLRMI